MRRFGVGTLRAPDGNIDHALATFLVDGQGRIAHALARARAQGRRHAHGDRRAREREAGRVLSAVSGFRPARGPTLLTLVAVLAFCALGVWQVRRYQWRTADLAEKSARIELAPVSIADAERDPDAFAFRRAELRGRFELADTILVGPVERGHELGARVFTPLRTRGLARRRAARAGRSRLDPAGRDAEASCRPSRARATSSSCTAWRSRSRCATPSPAHASGAARYFPRFSPDRPGLVAKLNAQLPVRARRR